MPPKAITLSFVLDFKILNFCKPKKVFFLLNNDAKKTASTFWFSLILISFKLCAEPSTKNLFFLE